MNSTPKEECEALMNAFLPFAEKMLAQHGEFYPVGGPCERLFRLGCDSVPSVTRQSSRLRAALRK